MSAERLREAARLMRERAQAATPGPWAQGMIGDRLINEVDCLPSFGFVTVHQRLGDDQNEGVDTAAHIASWHPVVALAVADLLDAQVDAGECPADPDWQAAVAVADAYLCGAS